MAKHTVIFANGEMHFPEAMRRIAQTADLKIAADGGFFYMQQLEMMPDLLIGDLDSVTAEQVSLAEAADCRVSRYPVDKDETDLELALLAAAEWGSDRITVVCALGGRLDQTLANIHLLSLPQLSDIDLRIDDGKVEVLLIRAQAEIFGDQGDLLSLLPLTPMVYGITTTNLKYPLIGENLGFHQSRGISNVMLTSKALVEIQSGLLLCIHDRKEVLE